MLPPPALAWGGLAFPSCRHGPQRRGTVTVAILAQGTSWAVAGTQAFFLASGNAPQPKGNTNVTPTGSGLRRTRVALVVVLVLVLALRSWWCSRCVVVTALLTQMALGASLNGKGGLKLQGRGLSKGGIKVLCRRLRNTVLSLFQVFSCLFWCGLKGLLK